MARRFLDAQFSVTGERRRNGRHVAEARFLLRCKQNSGARIPTFQVMGCSMWACPVRFYGKRPIS